MSILHHMRFTNYLFSLLNAHSPYAPYEDVKISHSGLAGKKNVFSLLPLLPQHVPTLVELYLLPLHICFHYVSFFMAAQMTPTLTHFPL